MNIPQWPPPVHVRRVLRRARRRLHALPPLERPVDLHAILTAGEARVLVIRGAYPLPPLAVAFIAEPPADRARRRRRTARRIEDAARRLLADELPAALDYLRGRVSP